MIESVLIGLGILAGTVVLAAAVTLMEDGMKYRNCRCRSKKKCCKMEESE